MRQAIKIVTGWLHATLIMAIIVPAIYMLGVERDENVEKTLFYKCLLIILPIAITGIAIKKCRNLWQYILICIATFAATAFSAWGVAKTIPYGSGMQLYVAFILIETILVMLGRFSGRLGRKRQQEVNMSNHEEIVEYDLLEKPEFFVLIFFFIIYAIAKNINSASVCNAALISSIVYLFATFLNQYVDKTEQYIALNKRVCNFPSKRIYGISGGVFAIFMLLLTLSILPSLFMMNYRQYRDLRYMLEDVEKDREDNIIDFGESPFNQLIEMMEHPNGENMPAKPEPLWVKILFTGMSIILLVIIIIAVIKNIRDTFRDFREVSDDNGDIVEKLEKIEAELTETIKETKDKDDSEKARIRRQYRRVIRKHRKDQPYPYETPFEIETRAGIAESEEGKQLHNMYEEARYGR